MIRHNGIEIDNENLIIRNGGHCYAFAPHARRGAFRICCMLILSDGVSKKEIFDELYGHRSDGGPNMGEEHIAVILSQSRAKFAAMGLKLSRFRSGTNKSRYHLIPA